MLLNSKPAAPLTCFSRVLLLPLFKKKKKQQQQQHKIPKQTYAAERKGEPRKRMIERTSACVDGGGRKI